MDIALHQIDGSLSVTEAIFNAPFNRDLVHQVTMACKDRQYARSSSLKNRSAVRGGGAKPWKQKGTGRARAGTSRSPIWTGGGVTFTKTARRQMKVNKKMHRAAMRSILSELLRLERLKVIDSFQLESIKTKEFNSKIKALNLTGRVLVILSVVEMNTYLASRNLKDVDIIDVTSVDPLALFSAENIVIEKSAVSALEELLV